ncbi:MAG: hypothetical protein AAGM84_16955 [Pseudomonadota bacterium]
MIWRRSRCIKALALALWAGAGFAEPPVFTETEAGAEALREMYAQGVQFFQEQYDAEVPGGFALIAATGPEALRAQIARAGFRVGRNMDDARTCPARRVGGVASREFVALCWNTGPVVSDQARATMVHELMHQVQYSLARDRPARRDGDGWLLGPAWMLEGSAEWVEEVFRNGRASDGARLFRLQEPARRNQTPLADLHAHGTMTSGRTYGVARFAAYLLAERVGDDALFAYWAALGRVEDREAAFAEAFGLSLADFERDFAAIRRHYGDARRWAGVAE